MLSDTKLEPNASRWRLHVIFAVAILCQAICWSLTSFDRSIFSLDQSFDSAVLIVTIVFVSLLVVPLISCFALSIRPAELGFSLGDLKVGAAGLLIATPIIAASLYFGCDDPEIKEYYPWAGSRLADSLGNMLLWFLVYFFYYLAFEFFYRGFLLRGLESELGIVAAVWIQCGMSVMMHFGKPTPELIASVPAGVLFAWFAIRTRSLIYVVLLHWLIGILNDVFAMHFKGWI